MKKSILFINQSSGYLMVDIINAHVPYYDNLVLLTGRLNPGYSPLHSKVKVTKGLGYDRSNSFKRFLSWLGFWFQSLYYIFIKYRHYKLYFVSNPPLNIFAAKYIKRDFAYLVYDIYPEALSEYNFIRKKSIIFNYWKSANQITYRKACRLFTISQGMKESIVSNNIEEDKIEIVPIWSNNFSPNQLRTTKNLFLEKYNINNKFIVCYSGNLGKSHPVEIIIEIANRLKNQQDVLFIIIGNGDKKKLLMDKQNDLKLKNLKILNYQSNKIFPYVLTATQIGIITLDSKASNLNVPSKTFNLMSVGIPLLCISNNNSELAQIIFKNKIGQNFEENDIDEMALFILELKNNNKLYIGMSSNSIHASKKYSFENSKKMILK